MSTAKTELAPTSAHTLTVAGQVANEVAARHAATDYQERKAANTRRAQLADLATFAAYLHATTSQTIDAAALRDAPEIWRGVTWGLVTGFVRWLLAQDYAVGTVNRKLSTVKTFVKVAAKGGVISADELQLIRAVAGYGRKEGKRVDAVRPHTRRSAKKPVPVEIDEAHAARLIEDQPDTPQGRRDAVIMALLLDHGLRVGELALLQVGDFNLKRGTFHLDRLKVGLEQRHRLTARARRVVAAWFATDAPAAGSLLRGSRRGGVLGDAGMSERSITERVRVLGEVVGLVGLSAHDCRHAWATRAAEHGTDVLSLMDGGGWSSPAMPARYVKRAAIANERRLPTSGSSCSSLPEPHRSSRSVFPGAARIRTLCRFWAVPGAHLYTPLNPTSAQQRSGRLCCGCCLRPATTAPFQPIAGAAPSKTSQGLAPSPNTLLSEGGPHPVCLTPSHSNAKPICFPLPI